MRRGISIAMVIFGTGAVLSGIRQFFPPFDTMFDFAHVTLACIFAILTGIHAWLNRRPLLRYFKRLRWWWILVGLGILSIIWGCIVVSTLVITGVW